MQKYFNKRGQAAAELAILGALILLAFGYIMNFAQNLSATQQVKMETFRRALQKAYIRNSSVDFTLKKNIRSANINSGFGHGQALSPQASSKVMWQKGRSGDFKTENQGSFTFWQISTPSVDLMPGQDDYGLPRQTKTIKTIDGGDDTEIEAPVSVYKIDETRTEKYKFSNNKLESDAGIDYTKTASLGDAATGTIYTHFDTSPGDPLADETPPPTYVDSDTYSYETGTDYNYNKSWSTPTEE